MQHLFDYYQETQLGICSNNFTITSIRFEIQLISHCCIVSLASFVHKFWQKTYLRKHIEKKCCSRGILRQNTLQKGVFREASGGCHDPRCERGGKSCSEEARRPWLDHLSPPPTFISHFLRLRPKQKLTAQPWLRCCIMVDGPI